MFLPKNEIEESISKDKNELKGNVTVIIKPQDKEIPLKKSILISTVLHPLVVFLAWGLTTLLILLGIIVPIFNKPQLKKDITFTLVTNPEAVPINKNTKNRSDRNSQAGGKHDPTKRESEPRPQAAAARQQQKASQAKQQPSRQQKSQQQKQQNKQTVQKQQNKVQPKQTLKQETRKPIEAPKPNKIATSPRPSVVPKNKFAIEVPKVNPNSKSGVHSGPIASSGANKTGKPSSINGSGKTSSGSNIGPVLMPSQGGRSSNGASSRGNGRFNSGGSYGSAGNAGNPSPGNPKGAPGIDAIREPDFGPYMKEVERRIKANWSPPNGGQSKKVVLLFTIARDGRLLSLKIAKSSGFKADDDAAISAVKLTAPFRPLPPEYKGSSVDINFTFDFYASSARRY